jgi:hypothetical protein
MLACSLACSTTAGVVPAGNPLTRGARRKGPLRCRAQSQGGHEPVTEQQRGIFQMSPKCGEATLQDARFPLLFTALMIIHKGLLVGQELSCNLAFGNHEILLVSFAAEVVQRTLERHMMPSQ